VIIATTLQRAVRRNPQQGGQLILPTEGVVGMARGGHRGGCRAQGDPRAAERMTMWPVDKRVGSVKNNDPSMIEADFPALEALGGRSFQLP